MRKMKAVSVGMVFGLIFAIIVIAFAMIFGQGVISDMFCFSGDTQTQKAFKVLENSVEDIYRKTRGSSDVLEVAIPNDARICFVNSSNPGTNIKGGWFPDSITEEMISVKGYNAWLKLCRGQEGFTIPHLNVKENFCIISSESVYIENKGHHVDIEILR